MKTIRLVCCRCDRDDMDGIDRRQLAQAKRDGWSDIQRVQSFARSMQSVPPAGGSIFEWWTHLGICPECNHAELYRS